MQIPRSTPRKRRARTASPRSPGSSETSSAPPGARSAATPSGPCAPTSPSTRHGAPPAGCGRYATRGAASGTGATTVDRSIVTCADGAARLNALWAAETQRAGLIFGRRLFPDARTDALARAELMAALPAAHDFLIGASRSAGDIMRQQMVLNAVHDAGEQWAAEAGNAAALRAYTEARAEAQTVSAYRAIGRQAETWVPLLRIVFECLYVGAFPMAVLLMLTPAGAAMVASIGAVAAPSQGASYYERDGYYAKDDPEHRASSAWAGRGAAELGLEGAVDPDAFRAVLEGHVPDGSGRRLGRMGKDGEIAHRPGRDLTLSAPKSVSLAGLVGGDARVVEAHDRAVARTLAWFERNVAETRMKDPETRRSESSPAPVIATAPHRCPPFMRTSTQPLTHLYLRQAKLGDGGRHVDGRT